MLRGKGSEKMPAWVEKEPALPETHAHLAS